MTDLRLAFRSLAKSSGFTATAILTLALGIGVNAAVFNVVRSLLFAPPTYAQPDGIVRVFFRAKTNPAKVADFSYPAYRALRDHNGLFSDTLASALLIVGVGEKTAPHRAPAAAVSANYFSALGVAPAHGRGFRPDEELSAPVAIVSHTFWQKRNFDPALLGSTLSINGRSFTVIGIMPKGFTGTTALYFTELWLPLGSYAQAVENAAVAGSDPLSDPAVTPWTVLARLKPGMTAATAQAALPQLAAGLAPLLSPAHRDDVLAVERPSRFASHGNDVAVAGVGVLLVGMAVVVLLVACLNLANTLLARGTARRKEIALRLALGGTRGRIVRQLLTEGFLLAVLGALGGLLLAWWGSDLLRASLGQRIPIDLVWTTGPQPALLGATFGFCVLGTLMFALGPALKLTRSGALVHLKDHAAEDAVRRRWKFLPRHPLVSVQIALSLALLTCAALFTRSAGQAAATETGLNGDGVFLVELDASLAGYGATQAQDLYRRLGERFAALPGVASASIAVDVPLSGMDHEKSVRPAGAPGAKPALGAKWNAVGENYFAATGLRLLRGRTFTTAEATQPDSPPVAIVNEELAKRLWPNGDVLGQRLQLAGDEATSGTAGAGAVSPGGGGAPATFEVVGVVPAIRQNLFQSKRDPGFYVPFARGFQSHVFFHVRFVSGAAANEAATAALLRRVVTESDAALPLLSLRTFARHLDENIQIWIIRAGAQIFSVFGVLALGLAVVGVYGVVAYSVARRTREIGIRVALGARPSVVQGMLLREGGRMLVAGLLAGGLCALGVGRIVSSLLYRVGAVDPIAFTVAPGILASAVFLACWLPARRATRVDPIVALRAE